VLQGQAIDFVPWNIIVDPSQTDHWVYIDDEWAAQDKIPVDYMLYRAFYFYLLEHAEFVLAENNLSHKVDDVFIKSLGTLYPGYDEKRLKASKLLEQEFQLQVIGKGYAGLGNSSYLSAVQEQQVTILGLQQSVADKTQEMNAVISAKKRLENDFEALLHLKNDIEQDLNVKGQKLSRIENSRTGKMLLRYYQLKEKLVKIMFAARSKKKD
jgi:hypothetical protein